MDTEIDPDDFDAAVFDLDGVLADTARIHASVWKQVFDRVLSRHQSRGMKVDKEFDIDTDYLRYVDGRPRLDGIRAFLASRRLTLPEGDASAEETLDTVAGIGRMKNRLVRDLLKRHGKAELGAKELLQSLRAAGVKVAVASSSANCATVLEAAGLTGLVGIRVDGVDARRMGLPGKPDPALFLETLRRLGIAADRAVLLEDADAGIKAGRRAGFKRVIGIAKDRERERRLTDLGADVVVPDLSHITVAGRSGSGQLGI